MPINKKYLRLLEEYSDSGWCKFKYKCLAFLSPWEAILLSYLIRLLETTKAAHRTDGWFWHSVQQVEDELYMGEETQKRTIRSLKEKDFIKVERRGLVPKRFFFVNLVKLDAQLQTVKSDRMVPVESDP